MSELKHIINRNYDSIVQRGLILLCTTKVDFLEKLVEEVTEVTHAIQIEDDENLAEELADVILTALNFAKHFDIDIEEELNKKIKINYARAKTTKQ